MTTARRALTSIDATDLAAHDSAVSARPTSSAMLGKQNCQLKTLVSDEVCDEFGRFARERGFGSTSDALRELVLVALYGPDFLIDLHRKRIASLGVNRSAIGTES
jgi:hypothetical protein